jgi:hypothetical protein
MASPCRSLYQRGRAVAGELSPYPPFDRASIQIRLKVPAGGMSLSESLFHLEVSGTIL